MSGDEAAVDGQILAEEFFKQLLASPEPTLASTVEHAVRGGRRTVRRRRQGVGAMVVSLAAVTAFATSALLGQHPQSVGTPGVTPSSTAPSQQSPTPAPTETPIPTPTRQPQGLASTSPTASSVVPTAVASHAPSPSSTLGPAVASPSAATTGGQ